MSATIGFAVIVGQAFLILVLAYLVQEIIESGLNHLQSGRTFSVTKKQVSEAMDGFDLETNDHKKLAANIVSIVKRVIPPEAYTQNLIKIENAAEKIATAKNTGTLAKHNTEKSVKDFLV